MHHLTIYRKLRNSPFVGQEEANFWTNNSVPYTFYKDLKHDFCGLTYQLY